MSRLVEVDPSDLEEGDEVVVEQDGVEQVRGDVHDVQTEAGRYGIVVDTEEDDGLGRLSMAWEQAGRAFYRVETEADR